MSIQKEGEEEANPKQESTHKEHNLCAQAAAEINSSPNVAYVYSYIHSGEDIEP